MMMRRWRTKLVCVAAGLLVGGIIIEIAVRVMGVVEHQIYEPVYAPFAESDDIPYVFQPNLQSRRARGLAVINTDSLGNRSLVSGATYEAKQSNEIRVAVVGDSVTFGEGIEETKDTYCAQLEMLLAERYPNRMIRVINFGVSAYSVKTMTATLEHRVMDVAPDIVVMALIPADLNLGRTPPYVIDGYTSSSPTARSKNLLRRVRFAYLVKEFLAKRRLARQGGGSLAEVPESYSYLREFRDKAVERGARPAFLLLPTSSATLEPLRLRMIEDELDVIDASGIVAEFTAEDFCSSPYDKHPSEAVHRRIAEVVDEKLADLMER